MSLNSRPGLRALAGILASAALLGLYARGGNGYLLGFVALVPWLLVLNGTTRLRGALAGGLGMTVAFVGAVFAWFGLSIAVFTGLHEALALLLLLLAAPLFQPQILVFALVRWWVGRHHGALVRALAGAAAWVAAEWLFPKLLGDTLGHGLFPSLWLRQAADIGGAAGLSVVLILVNEAIAAAIAAATAQRHAPRRALLAPLGAALALVTLLAGYGAWRLAAIAPTPETAGTPLKLGMVQSNLYAYERMRQQMGAYDVVRLVLDTHYALSREAVVEHQVDALLWSETVYPTTFNQPKSDAGRELDDELRAFVSSAGVPLVFGTYDLDRDGEYNAAAFVEPETGLLAFYRKSRPFPLTEYVPSWLDGPTLRGLLPWAGTWRPGLGARVIPLRLRDGRELPVQPLICLDDVTSRVAIDGARLGAQALIGMSNDSWFTDYPVGAELHLAVAAFRSIETRLPQVRVTANGYSAVIDDTGSVIAAAGMGERRLLIGDISVREPTPTLMVAWGEWVGPTALIAVSLLLVLGALGRRAHRHAQDNAARADSAGPFVADAVVLSPLWRLLTGLLRGFARGALLWMGLMVLLGDPEHLNPLKQLWWFAAVFLAPEAAAWCLLRAGKAQLRVDGGQLVVEQRARRIEIDAAQIAAVEPWRLPLPCTGAWLRLASGVRWGSGIALADPAGLARALIAAGAPASAEAPFDARLGAWLRALAKDQPGRWDRPLLKFVLFALVPALPAFRLHQVIAYGGTFGEYYTYGLQAYLTALGLWWSSWIVAMLLIAAALRALVEIATLLAVAVRPAQAAGARAVLLRVAKLAYFIGVPLWLAVRLWPG